MPLNPSFLLPDRSTSPTQRADGMVRAGSGRKVFWPANEYLVKCQKYPKLSPASSAILDPMWERRRDSLGQTPWWSAMAQARERIVTLARIVPDLEDRFHVLQESETPAMDLLEDVVLAEHLYDMISDPSSGKASDAMCQWLYETYQSGDCEMQLVVLRFIPVLCGVYLERLSNEPDEPLAGFEAVLLALYSEEAKSRGGKPVVVNIPSLAQPSLYHTPKPGSRAPITIQPSGYLSAPLEPQGAVKSTKRASILGVALELFSRKIASMPVQAKLEFCYIATRWAIQGYSWAGKINEIAKSALLPIPPVSPTALDGTRAAEMGNSFTGRESLTVGQLEVPSHERTSMEFTKSVLHERLSTDGDSGSYHSARDSPARDPSSPVENGDANGSFKMDQGFFHEAPGPVIPLPQDLWRPIVKVLGHCLMSPTANKETKLDAAQAIRALYARMTFDLLPEAVIATRSLLRLDAAATAAAAAAAAAQAQATTPTKRAKPEVLLQT